MMKKLLVLLVVCPAAYAQITITSTDFAQPNDTVWVSETVDPQIDFLTTGADMQWNFSSLVPQSQTRYQAFPLSSAGAFVQYTFGPFAAPAYQASHYERSTAIPLDAVGGFLPVNLEQINQFFKTNADAVNSLGYSIVMDGNEVPVKSDTIETYYSLPITYGEGYDSRGYTRLDMNPIMDAIWIQYRQRNTVVDGYGMLTTPYGTFETVRMMHVITETDSLYYDFLGTGMPTWFELPVPESHIYEWWGNGQDVPLLSINTSIVGGGETVNSVTYRDEYRSMDLGLETLKQDWNVYPNPVDDFLQVESAEPIEVVEVVDIHGKSIQRIMAINTTFYNVSTEDLKPGSYFIQIHTSQGIDRKSFLKF